MGARGDKGMMVHILDMDGSIGWEHWMASLHGDCRWGALRKYGTMGTSR
jgi:hypothetical protein